MAKIVKHKNEQANTKYRIWRLDPEKATEKKFYTPIKKMIRTKITTTA